MGPDGWFSFVVPASGAVTIKTTAGSISDGVMALYSADCAGTYNELACDDNGFGMPEINQTGLTPGDVLYIRIWEWWGWAAGGTMNICIEEYTPPAPTVQDCDGAIPVCQDIYTETVSYLGEGNYPNEIDSWVSCLGSGEKNDVWYIFTVQTGGDLCFDITPNDLNDDYDWAVYDLTNNDCSDIYSNAALEVSCNYSGTSGVTGANGAVGGQNEACIPVTAGNTYVLNVSQFSVSTNGHHYLMGLFAVIFDNVAPFIQAVSQPIPCGETTLSFNFSETVLCSSFDVSDLALTGPGGPYTLSALSGATCVGGAGQENNFTVTVSPALTTAGTFSLCLLAGSSVGDLCGNTAPAACLDFDIVNGVTADAGVNQCISLGGSGVLIGGSPTGSGTGSLNYAWDPTTGILGLSTIANPTVNPIVTTDYTVTVTDAAGCSSQSTVTINNSTTNSTTTTICDTYTWLAPLGDGSTYTTSGTYTNITTNAAGCPHTETLVLTINNSTTEQIPKRLVIPILG